MMGHVMKGDREPRPEAGMDENIAKPVKAEGLQHMLNKRVPETGNAGPPEAAHGSVITADFGAALASPLDIGRALSQLGGDRELLDDALATFLDNIPQTLDDLQSAVSTADVTRLEMAAHSLKGAASNICAEPTRLVAQRMEQLGRQGELRAADSLLKELRRHLDRLRTFCGALKLD
jgi:HPt (histidine-containing phosphotransfer) domain-containing protein